MHIFEWNNKRVTESDLFVRLDKDELERLMPLFPEIQDACVEFDGYYVFVNREKNTITPLRVASLAFGGMYYILPYGKEISGVTIAFDKLVWQPYTELESKWNQEENKKISAKRIPR